MTSNNLKYIIILGALHTPVSAQLNSCSNTPNTNIIYYVAKEGNDYKGNGSYTSPWRTIDFAIYKAKDKSTIKVKSGTYKEQVRIKKEFKTSVLIKA